MRRTLRSVLASQALRAGEPEVLAGGDRLDTRVRWVHVGEVRDITGLLQGGELILSTALAMRVGRPVDAVGRLRDLVAAGAAGLVVEVGGEFPQVPDEVVAAARAADFPVIALRRRVRFVRRSPRRCTAGSSPTSSSRWSTPGTVQDSTVEPGGRRPRDDRRDHRHAGQVVGGAGGPASRRVVAHAALGRPAARP